MARVFNLTQHPIKVGERTYEATDEGNPARLYTHKTPSELPEHSKYLGVRVIEPYTYEGVIGLPRADVSEGESAVIVSQMLAEWLRAADDVAKIYCLGSDTRVYTPDTDKGAIRKNGVIVGTTQLIFWMST